MAATRRLGCVAAALGCSPSAAAPQGVAGSLGTGRMDGKAAIVTGAANGIGRAVALVLAEQGCAVTIADRDIETGEQVAEHIRAHGGRSTFVETDVSSEASIENLVESAVATYGRLDALVNVAGVNILARLLDTTVERCASTRSVVQPTSIARPADQATTEFADT
jgi:NAD(P)-dependent dehydrogenase (short-subunit alcohol dehydrogenase family)